ncbi:MAG: DUF4838 domain-containing protein [Armatimonadota bacterium]
MRTAIALAAMMCAGAPALAAFPVVVEGEPACAIVLPPDAHQAVRRAAEELRSYVQRSTAAELPVMSAQQAGDGPAIVLRVGDWTGYPTTPLRRASDAYEIRVEPERVTIEGPNPGCVLFAADDFLRRFVGVRWLAPGEVWTEVPRHGSLSVPEGTRREEAALAIRALHTVGVAYHWDQDASEWMSRLRFNRKAMHVDRLWHTGPRLEPLGIRPLGGGHCMAFWLPNDVYFAEHPEYYGMDDGTRRQIGGGGTQLCLSNEESPAIFAHSVCDYAAQHPIMDIIGISMNDGWGFCTCPSCLARYRRDRPQPQWLSDLVFGFSNEVARGVAPEHEDRMLLQLAYTNFYDGPCSFEIEPNLIVEYCLWRSGFNRPVSDPGNETDAGARRQTLAWAERCEHLLIREYVGGVNLPDARVLAEDLRWYRDLGADGWFTEIHPHNWLPRERTWVVAHLLWDPDADVDALLGDFFRAAYGPARAPMREIYDMLERALLEAPEGFRGKSRLAAPYLVPAERWVEMLRLFDHAERLAAEDATRLARIDQTRRDLQALRNAARGLHDRRLLDGPPVQADGGLTAYGEALLTERNLLHNGSFELGPGDFGEWHPVRERGDYELGVTDELALHGRYSAFMRCIERGKSRWVYPHFDVDPEGIYEVNLWYRTTPDAFWTLRFGIAGGEGCNVRTWSTNTAGRWEHLRFEGLTPTSGQMVLWLDNYATGTVYLDAVSVTRVDGAQK